MEALEYWNVKNDKEPKTCPDRIEFETIDDVMAIDTDIKQFVMLDTAFNINIMNLMGMIPLPEDHILNQNGLQGLRYDPDKESPGKTQLDFALNEGAGAIESSTSTKRIHSGDSGYVIQLENDEVFQMSLYRQNNPLDNGMTAKVNEKKFGFDSKESATSALKKAAKLYGADLVGIAPYDERWLYKSEVYMPIDFYTGKLIQSKMDLRRPVDFGFQPKSVVVLAYEMDYDAYQTQPSEIGGAATTLGYSRMIENALRVATFLRGLGYNAHHAGNDISLSVPVAIQAGLGESSRMGLLVTEEFGARVRIAKVYTDLELAFDKPKTFGVKTFCEKCKKCSRVCPAGAISNITKTTDKENKPCNISNGTGVDKWYNDGMKCLHFWGENGTECGVCVAQCFYSRKNK